MKARPTSGRAQLAVALVLLGCDQSSAASPPIDAGAPDAPAIAQSAPAPAPAVPASNRGAPLELLRLTLTSRVEKKEPVDKLDAATPGQRVYAHLAIRNRSGEARKVHVSFVVNGKQRTSIDLNVEPSWSFRTWGYNTLQTGDTTGEIQVLVDDEAGSKLGEAKLPIRPQ